MYALSTLQVKYTQMTQRHNILFTKFYELITALAINTASNIIWYDATFRL